MKALMELDGSIHNCTVTFFWPKSAVDVTNGVKYFDVEKANGDIFDVTVNALFMSKSEGTVVYFDRSKTETPHIEIVHNHVDSYCGDITANCLVEKAYSGNLWFWIGFGFRCLLRKIRRFKA